MRFTRQCVTPIVLIFHFFTVSEQSRILAIFPNPGQEDIFNKALVKILLERGHHVDLIATFEMNNNSSENYTLLLNVNKIVDQSSFSLSTEFYDSNLTRDPVRFISEKYGNQLCNMMGHKRMRKLFRQLKENSKYDVILIETLGAKCFIGLGQFLRVPVIAISNQFQLFWIEESIGNPKRHFTELSETRNFFDRLKNSLMTLFEYYRFDFYTQRQTEIMRKYLDPKMPEIAQIEKNISLILSNSHFSLTSVRAVTSAFVQVAGLHITEDEGKLSSKLKSWMDKSTKGIVYFDLGPKIVIENLPRKVIVAFLSSFAKIKPFRVLMRVKDVEKLPLELPRNVKALTNISRIQVLAHKNVKAFITPGENLPLQEALYFRVPIVGISISIDHSQNLQHLVEKFVAWQINFEDLNECKISEALTIVLKVEIIRNQTKRWSKIFKDRPLSAKTTTIYWIEYIINNGPNSLKSPAVSLTWYQNELLDIYAFLLISLLSFTYLIVLLITKMIKINKKFCQ